MKRPNEAIERMRKFYTRGYMTANFSSDEGIAILAYLDSLKPWPVDLPKSSLAGWAQRISGEYPDIAGALRRLAELAPEREKRMVNLWKMRGGHLFTFDVDSPPTDVSCEWRKVGGPFEIEG